jgi:hypothetical protein
LEILAEFEQLNGHPISLPTHIREFLQPLDLHVFELLLKPPAVGRELENRGKIDLMPDTKQHGVDVFRRAGSLV